jgi:multicomponent Na+:H+ antiporter subunit E
VPESNSTKPELRSDISPTLPKAWGRFALTALALYAVWIVLSGRFYPQYLIIGAVGSVLIAAGLFHWSARARFPLKGFLVFIPWLIGQIVISNLRVARTALAPLSAIEPQFVKVAPGMGALNKEERALTMLGCAITLTPGTLTVDVTPDTLYVHALDADSARDIREGIMAQRVSRMFGA